MLSADSLHQRCYKTVGRSLPDHKKRNEAMKKPTALFSALLISSALTFGACGESAHVKRAKSIETKACSCKDMKCVKEVQKMLMEFQKEAGDKKVAKSDADKIATSMKKTASCITKALTKK
jgi:hypothetical protein